ncbi:uncharacterized protein LOC116019009 [Ipomoea triloba]|uniref:uncharacterized protein LOC116019009 n=1 Tax=Ipomoea triloba TaxID=35885 RepID=UPI00125E8E8A|nr:uncharacterized protein LOC116019009 [Ipomoea triloba]
MSPPPGTSSAAAICLQARRRPSSAACNSRSRCHLSKHCPLPSTEVAGALTTTKGTGELSGGSKPVVMPPMEESGAACFFDAGFSLMTGRATFGAVLFTPTGGLATARLLMPPYGGNLACKEVLSWLKGCGVSSVILHTNCSGLHGCLTAPMVAIRLFVGIATDGCWEIMSSFLNCYIRLICRSSNMIAHSLASKAYFQANQ